MKRQLGVKLCLLGAAAAVVTSTATSAKALNFQMHRQAVIAAATAMHYADMMAPNLATAPDGVSQQEWDNFLATVRSSLGKLNNLQTGLDAWHGSADEWARCTSGHPELFDSRENLSKIGTFRSSEFKYTVKREYSTGCGLVPLGVGETWRSFGSTMSWHAGNVDNLEDDIVLWYRPTNAAGLGLARKFLNDAFAIVGGSIIAPFVCAWGILSGDGCDLKKPFTLARRYDPVQAAFDLVPGKGRVTGNDYNGLWHYFDTAVGTEPRSSLPWEGGYNDVPGMYYAWGGPENVPGVLDVGIMIWADLSGLSINADDSRGVGRYAKYDGVNRSRAEWQGDTISRTEFSPVDNLARYGWEEYKKAPSSAKYLGWPLHALGDAAMPEHLASSTSWGHRPVEDAMDQLFAWGLGLDPETDELDLDGWYQGGTGLNLEHNGPRSARDILVSAYRWFSSWKDVQDTVHRLAYENRSMYSDYEIPLYDDLASVTWQTAKETGWDSAKQAITDSMKVRPYSVSLTSLDELIRPPMINSMGAMVAFLLKAADIAQNSADPSILCPVGTQYVPNGNNPGTCQSNVPAQPPPYVIDITNNIPETDPSPAGTVCTSNYQCLSGECVLQAGATTAYCGKGTAGDPCNRASDCATGYSCTNGECAVCTEFDCTNSGWPGAACQYPFQCKSGVCSNGICGLSGPNGECRTDADCSTADCENGICATLLPAGATCTVAAQCATQICSDKVICQTNVPDGQTGDCVTVHVCGQSSNGGPCGSNGDCLSGICNGGMCQELL